MKFLVLSRNAQIEAGADENTAITRLFLEDGTELTGLRRLQAGVVGDPMLVAADGSSTSRPFVESLTLEFYLPEIAHVDAVPVKSV